MTNVDTSNTEEKEIKNTEVSLQEPETTDHLDDILINEEDEETIEEIKGIIDELLQTAS